MHQADNPTIRKRPFRNSAILNCFGSFSISQDLDEPTMTLLRFLKLPCKSESKYEVICIILFFNLLVGFFCLQSWRTSTFMSGSINRTVPSDDSSIFDLILPQRKLKVIPTRLFPHPYDYIIPNSDFCSKVDKLSFIILVCTSTGNFLERQTIRETWGSVSSLRNNTAAIRVGFLLGATPNLTVQQKIMNESVQYSDIIQEDFIDSYRNLTLKSVMLLKWTTMFCPNVQYVMKTDDDMYINTDKLIKTFLKLPRANNSIYGTLFHQVKPIRDASSKWFVPKEQFKEEFFPNYLSGTCYVMNRDAVPILLEVSYDLPFVALEDVFITGMCAQKAGVARVQMWEFDYGRRQPTGCSFKDVISGHHVRPSEMRTIWTELHNKKIACETPKSNTKALKLS